MSAAPISFGARQGITLLVARYQPPLESQDWFREYVIQRSLAVIC